MKNCAGRLIASFSWWTNSRMKKLALTAPKQQQEKLEQNRSAFTDLTTSTINGKTMVRTRACRETDSGLSSR